jgi:predicted NACHT family NTPase/tetratricopeptide (TPR) repeat protein
VALSPDGKRALSGSADKTLKLWDVANGWELRAFSGHKKWVSSVAFSPDGKLALSGSEDNTLKLWDVESGRELRTFRGHLREVFCVAFSPDGKLVLSGSCDNTLKLWDVESGRELRTFSGHSSKVRSVAFSPDGKRALSGSCDNTLKLWDVESGRELRTFSGHLRVVQCVAFSPEGRLVLSGSEDNTLKLWDVESGRELRTFSGHSGKVKCVVFSPDGKLVLSGSGDNTLKLWDAERGLELRTFSGHTHEVLSVAFSPDGKLALSGSWDHTLKLWDVESGRELRTFSNNSEHVFGVAFSPNGLVILSTGFKKLQLRDLAGPARYREFEERLSKARSAMRKNENDPEALKTFGEWYAFRGVWDWAVELLERARKNGAEAPPILARCYWQLDKLPEAAAEFKKELDRVQALAIPDDLKSRTARENEELHLKLCINATSTPPFESAQWWVERGDKKEKTSDWGGALAYYDQALKQDPALGPKWLFEQLSQIAKAKKDWKSSLGYLRRWTESAADDPMALSNYAWELLNSQDEALRDYKTALPLALKAVQFNQNKDCKIIETLAIAYARNGQFKEAVATQKKAISLLPARMLGEPPSEERLEYECLLKEFQAGLK